MDDKDLKYLLRYWSNFLIDLYFIKIPEIEYLLLMCIRDKKTNKVFVEKPNRQVRECYENFGIPVPHEIDLDSYIRQLYEVWISSLGIFLGRGLDHNLLLSEWRLNGGYDRVSCSVTFCKILGLCWYSVYFFLIQTKIYC